MCGGEGYIETRNIEISKRNRTPFAVLTKKELGVRPKIGSIVEYGIKNVKKNIILNNYKLFNLYFEDFSFHLTTP
jgi:hypothetical protein